MDIGPGSASDVDRVYLPGRQQIWSALLMIACFVAGALLGVPACLEWLHGGEMPPPKTLALAAGSFFFVNSGLMILISAMLGLPKLHVSSTGVALEGLFLYRWANFDSLSYFGMNQKYVGSFRNANYSAVARIIGSSAHPLLRIARRFVIHDVFQTPLIDLMIDINDRQLRYRGWSGRAAGTSRRADVIDDTEYGVAGFSFAGLTFLLISLLAAVFAAEELFSSEFYGLRQVIVEKILAQLGGLQRSLVFSHLEVYRLFTALVLHANVAQLVANCVGLLVAGRALEKLAGREWFLALFFLGGLGGSCLSLAFNPGETVSVGASGAVMALFAALFVLSFRLPPWTPQQRGVQIRAILMILGVLFPAATAAAGDSDFATQINVGGHTDVGAHIGGLLIGLIAGSALLLAWRDGEKLPPRRDLAAAIGCAGVVGLAIGVVCLAYQVPVPAGN